MDEFELEMLITSVQERNDGGQDYDLSETQVRNLAVDLLEYDLEPEDFERALDYTVKMRKTAEFYRKHNLEQFENEWKRFFSKRYQIRRVLIAMGLLEEKYDPIPFNRFLEDSLSDVESDILIDNIQIRKRQM